MTKIAYIERNFSDESLTIIRTANRIINEYQGEGYDLTLRQLYYQFVSKDLIPNTERSYKRLGDVISNARLAGLVDWDAITDRTRGIRKNSHWTGANEIINSALYSFQLDRWVGQTWRVEVWIEKDALIGILESICSELDVTYISCRGYMSQSEMWEAAQRHLCNERNGQRTVSIHLGDHDPSGIDMSRDIEDRLKLFGANTQVIRIALNWDQVEEYRPPPNPAKTTDSRAGGYIERFGRQSWELDALRPQIITSLIREHVLQYRDETLWNARVAEEREIKKQLTTVAQNWDDVVEFLGGRK